MFYIIKPAGKILIPAKAKPSTSLQRKRETWQFFWVALSGSNTSYNIDYSA